MPSIYADMTNSEKQVAEYLASIGLYGDLSFQYSYMMKRIDLEYGHLTSTFQG
jgi:hypothetical protein